MNYVSTNLNIHRVSLTENQLILPSSLYTSIQEDFRSVFFENILSKELNDATIFHDNFSSNFGEINELDDGTTKSIKMNQDQITNHKTKYEKRTRESKNQNGKVKPKKRQSSSVSLMLQDKSRSKNFSLIKPSVQLCVLLFMMIAVVPVNAILKINVTEQSDQV